MNNKGQVLVLFVLIIPVLILGMAYIIDNVYILYHTNKLNNINSLVIKDASINNLSREEIIEYVKKNDENIEIIVDISDNKIAITLEKKLKSIFGGIIGKNSYNLKSTKTMPIVDE